MIVKQNAAEEYVKSLKVIQKEIIKQCDTKAHPGLFTASGAGSVNAYNIAVRILAAHMIAREVDGVT